MVSGAKKDQHSSQSGAVLMYIVGTMVILAVLGAAMVSFFGAGTTQTASPNCRERARFIAEGGLRYAVSQLNATNEDINGIYSLGNEDKFEINITNSTNGTIKRIDFTVNATTCFDSSYSVDARVEIDTGSGEVISFEEDFDNFVVPEDTSYGESGEVDPISKLEEEQKISIGNNLYDSGACLWYTGSLSSCTNGVCDFGGGVRAYFAVDFHGSSKADGFTFAVFNRDNNEWDACGGSPNRSMGELLAYAGPGVTGDGIQRPKLGVEFDIFPNPGSGSRFYAGSRQDPERGNQEKQHIAAIYWGDDDYLDEYSWWLGSLNTYDDNRHGNGAGNSTEPTNPYQFDNGVYAENAKKWLKTKKEWHFRIEIDRASEATIYPPGAGSDAYRYITRVWARKNNAGEEFKNVKTDFDPDPDLEYEVFLHPDYHEMLKEVSAGFTQATGGETQSAEIYDFKMKFKKEE